MKPTERRDHDTLLKALQPFSRALAIHDALPYGFRPSDETPLRECLAGVWPTVADLRALVEWGVNAPPPSTHVVLRDELKRIAETALGAAEAEHEWTDAVDVIALALDAAQGSATILLKAAQALRRIVEGIDGTMSHGTWRDDHGRRLKDTPQWVALCNAVYDAQNVVAPKTQAGGKSDTLLQTIADKINGHQPSPAATDEYAAGYADGRYDAWLVVQGAADDTPSPQPREAGAAASTRYLKEKP